ncbi:MAG: BON domain-containing protein [Porticoccus sp.]|nr:BON domain-containing protein [Porticoccus sp.]
MKPMTNRILTATSIAVFCSSLVLPALAGDNNNNQGVDSNKHQMDHNSAHSKGKYSLSKPELRNAWLEGKLETALLVNRHLNNFTISNEVHNGKATLTGSVESDVDRELAEQVALSIEGIADVDNQLTVDKAKAKSQRSADANERSLSQKLDDMTTTASVKSKLLTNQSTHGLSINVDTFNNSVSLNGDVATPEEKQLAEKIAANTDGVHKVKNMLNVKSKS